MLDHKLFLFTYRKLKFIFYNFYIVIQIKCDTDET